MIFGHFWNYKKRNLAKKNREIDLFDYMSFFLAWTFLNFLAHCVSLNSPHVYWLDGWENWRKIFSTIEYNLFISKFMLVLDRTQIILNWSESRPKSRKTKLWTLLNPGSSTKTELPYNTNPPKIPNFKPTHIAVGCSNSLRQVVSS